MKCVFLFFVLGMILVLVSSTPRAQEHSRGCRYIMGRCVEECKEGTHGYHSACRSPTWSQRTCEKPEAEDMGPICDLSRCDCDEPTVLDRTTGKCVKFEDCPKKS